MSTLRLRILLALLTIGGVIAFPIVYPVYLIDRALVKLGFKKDDLINEPPWRVK